MMPGLSLSGATRSKHMKDLSEHIRLSVVGVQGRALCGIQGKANDT